MIKHGNSKSSCQGSFLNSSDTEIMMELHENFSTWQKKLAYKKHVLDVD